MYDGLIDFLRGGTAIALFAIGLQFLRFWRDSRDRLFAFFCGAFWTMAVSQIAVLALGESGDYTPYAYWLRLLAFALIITAIVEKNLHRDGS